ncbi:TonB-dependent siderophore receptor [Duganella sp. FT80W]|uniref:TonB-dependent siderophore receptor n=1 Tax=Duganella guangzhouensis TaxID=2666084 RepID=A0A6I2L297_9BURK|nr:TonB-dependent siderophore receptor [Duganella guangzhouensis]MRW92288.1 TonB-dependent siderophore receptor [Duganella guangzhouensis]
MSFHVRSAVPARLLFAGLISTSPLALAADVAADADADQALPQVTVSGDRSAGLYNPTHASGATRTDAPLMEVPQAVRVMTAQQIEDIGALRLADTIAYVSGISRLNDFGGTWDNFSIRGFSSTDMGFLVNGFPGSRGYNPPRDTATVEQFEFLKGPASAVYGSSEPGGTINIVTKKPKFTTHNVAELSLSDQGLRRATLDSTGALSSNVAYRVNLMSEEGETRSPLLHNKRHLIAPALTWVIDGATTLNYEAEFLRADTPLDRGVINVRGVLGTLPRDLLLNEPSDGNMVLTSNTHQLTLDRVLSDHWRARFGASYKESTFEGYYTEATSLATDNRTLNRQYTWRTLPSRDASIQAELHGKLEVAGMAHELLFGAEASSLFMNMEILRSANTTLDIYNPVYGTIVKPALTSRTTSSDEQQRVKALFAQDQISLSPQWKLLGGLRFDQYDQHVVNRVAKTDVSQQQNALSPRAGLTYLPNAWSSWYVSAGKSFRGNSGTDISGKAFDPQHSTAYEAGVKLQTRDERLGANFAVFDITKTNVLTSSDAPGYSVAAGEVKSSGFEADSFGQIDDNWRVTANLAWIDARVSKDKTLAVGTRLMNVAKTSGGVLLIREAALEGGGRWGVGGGANYVGNRSGNTADTYSLPAYTTAKLLGFWQINKTMRVSLDVNNLFNRQYYSNSWGNLYVVPGAERSIATRLKVYL